MMFEKRRVMTYQILKKMNILMNDRLNGLLAKC